jgi:hypothetical protein
MDSSVVTNNQASRERLVKFTKVLTSSNLSCPLGQDLTVSAIFAHIAFWDRRTRIAVEQWSQNRSRRFHLDVDMVNEAAQPMWMALASDKALGLALEASEEVNRCVEGLSREQIEELLTNVERIGIWIDRSRHRAAHLNEVEQAVGRQIA